MASTNGDTVENNANVTDLNKVWLEAILKKDSREEEIMKIVNYSKSKATVKGDNYTSDLTRVTMDIVTGSGKTKKVSVIIKELPATQYRRAFMGVLGLFLREIVMYREILPSMADIMDEFEDYSEPVWGKGLEYRSYDRIVMQDLSKLGYKMNDRRRGLDLDHSLLVMKSLAKLHALSVVLMSKGLIPMEIFSCGMLQAKAAKVMMKEMYDKILDNFVKTVKEKWEPEWQFVADRIQAIAPDIMNILGDLLERDDTKFNVLNHGDCWLNNILFKYGIDLETPITAKFVDYQLCFFNTPAYDLQYFLSSSASHEVRSKHKDQLLEQYHKSLLKFTAMYNYNGPIITLDELKEEVKRLSLFAVVHGIMILPIVYLEKTEEFPDMENMIKDHVENKTTNFDWLSVGGANFISYLKLIIQDAVDNHKL